MKTRTIAKRFEEDVIAYVPEDCDIDNLVVGSLAPDCFGRLRTVKEIFHIGKDIHGRKFCCFYTEFGPTSSISQSMKSGELIRTVGLTSVLKSAECDALEAEMNH